MVPVFGPPCIRPFTTNEALSPRNCFIIAHHHTHKVRFWTPSGVGIRPPAATHRVRVDAVQLVTDEVTEAGRGQVEDADGQGLEQHVIEVAWSLVVAENVVFRSCCDWCRRYGAQRAHW